MHQIPKPDEVHAHFIAAQAQKIASLRNRIIEHLRDNDDQPQHRIPLHGEVDAVVDPIIEECVAQGWQAARDRVPVKYGPPVSNSGRITRVVISDGHDDLVLTPKS